MRKHVLKFKCKLSKEELVAGFIDGKRVQGLGDFAIGALEYTLGKFFASYTAGLEDENKLSRAVQMFLFNKKKGAAYYNKQLSILSQYFRYCIEMGIISVNPCEGMKFKRTTSRVVDHDKTVIRQLLKLPNQKKFPGFRDYALMVLILDTGIRPFEAIQLRIKDIQERNVKVRAEVSKTRTERYLPISNATLMLIRKLISARDETWEGNGEIFCGYGGRSLHKKTIE